MASLSQLGALDDAVAYRIYRLQRLLRLSLVRTLEQHGEPLVPETYFLLYRVCQDPGMRQQDLVDPVIGDRPNVSRLLRKMAAQHLIERVADPDDGRVIRIQATSQGTALMRSLTPIIRGERDRLFGGLSEEEALAFNHVLDRVITVLT